MLLFLHGADTFRSTRQLSAIKKQFAKKKQGDIVIINAENFDINTLKNHLGTQGLFASEKLIIIKNLLNDGKKEMWAKINDALALLSKETTLIFFENGKVDKRTKIYKKLTQLSKQSNKQYYPEFVEPNPYELKNWITDRIKKSGKQINPDALAFLVDACQDRWQAYNETEKLITSPYNPITLDNLKKLILPKLDDNIFALTDALSSKNLQKSVKLLNDQLESGAQPLYLLSMIGRQVKILIKIKSAQNDKKLSYGASERQSLAFLIQEHPFVVQKALPSANKFQQNDLINFYEKILDTDITLKSSKITPKTLLTKLIYDIIK